MFALHMISIVRLCIKRSVLLPFANTHVLETRTAVVITFWEVTHGNLKDARLARWKQCCELIIVPFMEDPQVLFKVVWSLKAILALVGRAFGAWVQSGKVKLPCVVSNMTL